MQRAPRNEAASGGAERTCRCFIHPNALCSQRGGPDHTTSCCYCCYSLVPSRGDRKFHARENPDRVLFRGFPGPRICYSAPGSALYPYEHGCCSTVPSEKQGRATSLQLKGRVLTGKRQDGMRRRRGQARHVGAIQSGMAPCHGAPPDFVRSCRGYAAHPSLENDKREVQVLYQDLDRRIACFQSRWVPRASAPSRPRPSLSRCRPEIGVEAIGWAVASNTRDLSQPAKFRRRRRRER
jgi:hypothetical protein